MFTQRSGFRSAAGRQRRRTFSVDRFERIIDFLLVKRISNLRLALHAESMQKLRPIQYSNHSKNSSFRLIADIRAVPPHRIKTHIHASYTDKYHTVFQGVCKASALAFGGGGRFGNAG
jgi:hypothetical protein